MSIQQYEILFNDQQLKGFGHLFPKIKEQWRLIDIIRLEEKLKLTEQRLYGYMGAEAKRKKKAREEMSKSLRAIEANGSIHDGGGNEDAHHINAISPGLHGPSEGRSNVKKKVLRRPKK